MNLDEFRSRMVAYRQSVNEEARSLKDSYFALDRLHDLYGKFDIHEQAMANQILAEWALHEDENVRFDALTLIDDFKIASATPTLQTLMARLASSASPGAPFEMKKVARITEGLLPIAKAKD